MSNYHKAAFTLLICIAAFLRLYDLETYPLSVNQDELSNIYDGYCISETSSDRAGDQYPLVVRGFGAIDYRPALCSYLTSVPIHFLGFSIFSGRLIAVVLGVLSLVLLFFFSRKLINDEFALIVLLFATFSPWHILFSRLAHEGAILPPFFIILILYLWYYAKSKNYSIAYTILLGLAIGISVNAYQATKVSAFLLCILIGTDILLYSSQKIKNILMLGIPAFIGALPQIIVLIQNSEQFFSRASGESLPYNGLGEYLYSISKNIFSNLEPDYLFFSFGQYNNLSIGRLLFVECLFFYSGLFLLSRVVDNKSPIKATYIYIALVIVILPSALTLSNPHALRASGFLIIAPIVSGTGLYFLIQYLKISPTIKKISLITITLLIVLNGVFNIYNYTRTISLMNEGHQHFLVVLGSKLKNYISQQKTIYVERYGNQPYLYYAAFGGIKPKEFHAIDKVCEQPRNGWDDFYKMGNINFKNSNEIQSLTKSKNKQAGNIFVVMNPIEDAKLLEAVQWAEYKAYIYSSY